MGILAWASQNWFSLLQSIGIIGGLIFTGFSFRLAAKKHQASNLIEFKQEHRKLWMMLYAKPELRRVLRPDADIKREPVNDSERLFVKLLITHLHTAYELIDRQLILRPDNLEKDVAAFFVLPIPKSVWESVRHVHDPAFVRFVESACT